MTNQPNPKANYFANGEFNEAAAVYNAMAKARKARRAARKAKAPETEAETTTTN